MHSGARWDAGGGGQRPQQLAQELAKNACVVYLNTMNPNRIERPLVNPAIRQFSEWRDWIRIPASHRLFYTAFPSTASLEAVNALCPEWTVIYDCIDDWRHFATGQWYDEGIERAIVQRADLVICTARSLVEHIEQLGARRPPPVHFLPNSTSIVGQPWNPQGREVDCVFVGWLAESWLDWNLFKAVAEKYTVQLIGQQPPAGLPFEHRNAEWVGVVPNSRVMEYLSRAKVGIIPFRDIPLVYAVWPIKYADYLAAGLPTVASYMPELDVEPWARVTYTDREFVRQVDRAVAKNWPRHEIAAEAQKHTGAARVAQLTEWLRDMDLW